MKNKNFQHMSKGKNNNFNDKIFTPKGIVKEIIKWVKPKGTILEPFLGEGAFYNELIKTNNEVFWTEIDKNKDFFKFDKKVDYIITNPPYSIFTDVLEHSFKIADNVIFLIPHMKVYASDKRLNMIENYGTYEMKRFKVPKEWSINFPIGAYWFKRKINNV